MKKLVTLFASFFMLPAFTGGISVGSGQGKVIVGLSLESGFTEEIQLMLHAEKLIDQISSGRNKKINKMITSGSCDKSYSRVDELDLTTYYPINKDGQVFIKEHVGFLTVELKDCAKPEKIKTEQRFGWSELWD